MDEIEFNELVYSLKEFGLSSEDCRVMFGVVIPIVAIISTCGWLLGNSSRSRYSD